MESVDRSMVECLRCQGKIYVQISEYLREAYPNTRGLLARSVQRYCLLHGISKLSDAEVDDIVVEAVEEVNES